MGRLLAAWSCLAAGRPVGVAAVILVLTGLAGAVAALRLGVNTDEDALFSDDLPHLVRERHYHEAFPLLFENIVIVIDAPSPERARDATAALAARMRRAPDLFHHVFVPQGGFFEEHALLYMEVDELDEMGDRLARVQPYLTGLAADGTLRGLANILARGVRAVREGAFEGEELAPMFDRLGEAIRAGLESEAYELSWAEVVAGNLLGDEARRRMIVAQPVVDFEEFIAAERPLEAIRSFSRELGLEGDPGIRIRMTGEVVLSYEEMFTVREQARLAGLASFVMVSGLLFAALRSVRLALATILTLVVGLIWTAAFAALAIGHLNIISTACAVLFIGLAVDFGVHLGMRYQELVGRGQAHLAAVAETARGVGASLLLCALTTAIGFFAFVPTDFAGVAELGLIAGGGMFISLFLTFTLLPALYGLRPGLRPGRPLPVVRLPSFPLRFPRAVAVGALLAACAALLVLPEVRFDPNPLRVRDPNAESVQTYRDLLAGRSSPWSLNVVAKSLEEAEVVRDRLRSLELVDEVTTVSDFVPADQGEKLAILEDVALFLPPIPQADGATVPPTLAEQLAALQNLRAELEALLQSGRPEELMAGAELVRTRLVTLIERVENAPNAESAILTLEESLLGRLPEQLRSLERALATGPITLSDLPPDLLQRMVGEGGLVRVRVFPSEDLGDTDALARFIDSVRSVSPEVTGEAVKIYEASRAVVAALQQAFVAASLVIAILLILLWRTLGDMALVMFPLALASLATAAGAVLVGIPFNFADVIVLPLLLGIGVDSAIHLVHRSRMRAEEGESLLQTSTARAVVFSALTTIASFGTLGFATHRGMASLGQLLTLGVVFTLVCNLMVLPALIELRRLRRRALRA